MRLQQLISIKNVHVEQRQIERTMANLGRIHTEQRRTQQRKLPLLNNMNSILNSQIKFRIKTPTCNLFFPSTWNSDYSWPPVTSKARYFGHRPLLEPTTEQGDRFQELQF